MGYQDGLYLKRGTVSDDDKRFEVTDIWNLDKLHMVRLLCVQAILDILIHRS